ncbi:DMT family transporter [Francisellaceae bacterium CB300]
MNTTAKGYIKILLALIFWASLYHIAPIPLGYVDIYLVGLFRYVLASLIFLAVHYYFLGCFIPCLSVKQWLYIIAVGFFGIFLYNLMFLWAEKLISGNIVAIIYAFAPCLITILSSYIFKMKVNIQAKLGILVALLGTIGVVMFSAGGDMAQCLNGIEISLGEVLSVLAVICFAAYAILGKCCVREGVHMITINTYGAIVGMIMFAIVSAFKSDFSALAHTDVEFWGSMLYISAFATVIAYVWYLGALEEIGVYKTAVFQNMLPFFVIVIGFLFKGETISTLSLLFSGVVFLGVYMTNVAVNKK